MHAYECLNAGGRLVAIMGAGSLGGSRAKVTNLVAWLDDLGAVYEKLPENSFKDADKATGVSTYLVMVDRAAGGDYS